LEADNDNGCSHGSAYSFAVRMVSLE